MKNKNRLINAINAGQSFIVLIILVVAMSIALPYFFTAKNITNLTKQLAVNFIVAAAYTQLMISGEMDISVGGIVGMCSMLVAVTITGKGPESIWLALLLSLSAGLAVGVINGIITLKGHIPSFITTLGTQMITRSLALIISKGAVIADFPKVFGVSIAQNTILGIPLLFIISVIVYAVFFVYLKYTRFGMETYAVGSNAVVAALSGTNVQKVKMRAFMINGIVAGFAAFLLTSRLMAVQTDVGSGLEFEVIAAVVIGGTSLAGGSGNVLLTAIGVIIMGLIRNFLNLAHISVYWNNFVTGAVVIVAVLMDSFRKYLQQKVNDKIVQQ